MVTAQLNGTRRQRTIVPVVFEGKSFWCHSVNLGQKGDYEVLLTPDEAQFWFEHLNGTNPRKFDIRHARKIRDAIIAGDFPQLHPARLLFDEDSRFFDGQHRVWGVWQAGTPLWVKVATGESRDIRKSTDRGKRRDLGVLGDFSSDPDANERIATFVKSFHRIKYEHKDLLVSVYESTHI